LYGGKFLNNAGNEPFTEEDFEGYYQNVEIEDGNRMFLILWLHAYKYTIKDMTVKTQLPEWATSDFKINPLQISEKKSET
jgi:hypothetical protein